MKKLQNSILATFLYHDIFDYPLTEQEVFRLLVQIRNPKSEIPNKSKILNSNVQNNIKILIEKKRKIFKKGNYYCLVDRKGIINLRKKREKYSRKKIKIAKKSILILKFIPWIRMIGITGALSMNNSGKDDDIDLLVITEKNRLWLTRLLMVLVLEILGKRRRSMGKRVKDKVCLNMFLDEKVLLLFQAKQNLFTAHEIAQMRPIFNRDKTYERFLKVNKWVKNYLPNGIKNQKPKTKNQKHKLKNKKITHYSLLFTHLLDKFEKIAYQFQLKYMKSKITSEKISSHFAFFHLKNRASEILRKYEKGLSSIDSKLC